MQSYKAQHQSWPLLLLVILITGCATPYRYATKEKCGVSQYEQKWAEENVVSLSWSGECKSGLAEGKGVLKADLKDHKNERFEGLMAAGMFVKGEYLTKYLTTLVGEFQQGYFIRGKVLRPVAKLNSEGIYVTAEPRNIPKLSQGIYYYLLSAEKGIYVKGTFDTDPNNVVFIEGGKGIIQGEAFDSTGKLIYWIVKDQKYFDKAAYDRAITAFNDAEKRRREEAQIAERRRKEQEQAAADKKSDENWRTTLGVLNAALGVAATVAKIDAEKAETSRQIQQRQRERDAQAAQEQQRRKEESDRQWQEQQRQTQAQAQQEQQRRADESDQQQRQPQGQKIQVVAKQKRQNVPEAIANGCISLSEKLTLYGGFKNSCAFMVEMVYCAYHPNKNSWLESFNCENNKFALMHVPAYGEATAHTLGAETIYWFGCNYGESLNKWNGITIKDAHFVGSRPVARCAEF